MLNLWKTITKNFLWVLNNGRHFYHLYTQEMMISPVFHCIKSVRFFIIFCSQTWFFFSLQCFLCHQTGKYTPKCPLWKINKHCVVRKMTIISLFYGCRITKVCIIRLVDNLDGVVGKEGFLLANSVIKFCRPVISWTIKRVNIHMSKSWRT